MSTVNTAGPVSFEAAQSMIAADPALDEALARVRQLDFTMLKRKLVIENGWTPEMCDEVEDLYIKFLALNARYPDRKDLPDRADRHLLACPHRGYACLCS